MPPGALKHTFQFERYLKTAFGRAFAKKRLCSLLFQRNLAHRHLNPKLIPKQFERIKTSERRTTRLRFIL